MVFASRQDAGRRLGRRLQEMAVEADLVAGLPRGGVLVAAEVANILHRPLDVIVVRKIGHPWHREFAVGALAEDGVWILDEIVATFDPSVRAELETVIQEEKDRLREYCLKFRPAQKNNFNGRRVLLVDDGLATGASAEAAIGSARIKNARQIILAVPVASTSACRRLAPVAERILTLITDPDLNAVGQYYRDFPPASDEDVLAVLPHQPANCGETA